MENPIQDNRIVNDRTFATRLKGFISNVQVNDLMSEEEQEYLLRVANNLIQYQCETATSQDEIEYLERLNFIKRQA